VRFLNSRLFAQHNAKIIFFNYSINYSVSEISHYLCYRIETLLMGLPRTVPPDLAGSKIL
jgi:hypothetical protein